MHTWRAYLFSRKWIILTHALSIRPHRPAKGQFRSHKRVTHRQYGTHLMLDRRISQHAAGALAG
jgi:hypothetical protein